MDEKETLLKPPNDLLRQEGEKSANMAEKQEANLIAATLLGVALIAAGLAGNYFKFPLFLNIDFLFGSIFAMLALQFFGIGRGILAAAIIAGYTYILWNHPYAIIIMTAEVAVVGWLTDRRKMGLVLADTLYWLIIGMPLVYLFYHVVMQVPFSNTSIVMTKQAVNGIANALVARLIFTGFTLLSRASLMSYREIIYNLLALFVLGPALIMMAIGSRTDFAETDLRIRTSLMQESRHTAHSLEAWVVNRTSAIFNLAEMAASIPPEQMQSYLELAVNSDVNFQRVGLQDSEATTTAYFPLLDEQGHKNIGMSFADRPYIPVLKQTLKPMLSEVMMGKIGSPKPVVALIAPVVIHGEYGGFIGGILSLKQILEHLDMSTGENASLFTLIDKNGNVIMTNRTDQTVMTPFVRGKGTLNRLDAGISQWMPVVPPNTPISERWKNSFYIAETAIGSLAEWKLILEQPVAPLQKTLYDNYTGKLTLLFLLLIGALALAEFLSRSSIATLEKLRLITHDLPGRLVADEKEIAWPESGIIEANHLINNFREMTDLTTAQFNEILQVNNMLEQRVEERIEALSDSERHYRARVEGTPGIVYSFSSKRGSVYCSSHVTDILGYSPEQLYAQPMLWHDSIHPDDLPYVNQTIREGTASRPFCIEYRIKDAQGNWRWFEDRSTGYKNDGTDVIMEGFALDITKRKHAEETINELNREFFCF